MRLHAVLVFITLAGYATAQNPPQNPFAPPSAKLHYALDRVYDLQHVAITLDVNYPNRSIAGTSTNTVVMLRDGLTEVPMHAGQTIRVTGVRVNGAPAKFVREGRSLRIATPRTKRGQRLSITTTYVGERQAGGTFGAGGGWHWISPTPQDPLRVGFWTQGETEYNREWAPTWDYPNDFATSETVTTVPKNWDVVGNGVLVSNTVRGERRTFHWKMNQPHVTYLISLCGGPFDIEMDKWRDVPLWYVVPRGYRHLIKPSFEDTRDMMEFFSDRFGVKYPWPKYAQNAMHDFGGGMENVSATTLGFGALTDPRAGFRTMSGLNAHELGHQWFGDLVTCKDWGHIWLNESFATFVQGLYFEHARGAHAYARDMDGKIHGYVSESLRYKRPIMTYLYPNADAMFDSHSYPKGAVVLHALRRMLGDEAFFAGLKRYLTLHRYQPVETSQLCRALTETSGVNLEPFFEQWILKPGHPELEYDWRQDGMALTLDVRQVQPTADGTPIYTIPTKVGVISGGTMRRFPITLNAPRQTATFTVGGPVQAVILDPDHDFLRVMRHSFGPAELLPILKGPTNAVDKQLAVNGLAHPGVADADLLAAAEVMRADAGQFPAVEDFSAWAPLKREALRPFYRGQLASACEARRVAAVRCLQALPPLEEDTKRLHALINDREFYSVIEQVVSGLDKVRDAALLERVRGMKSLHDRLKQAAEHRLR